MRHLACRGQEETKASRLTEAKAKQLARRTLFQHGGLLQGFDRTAGAGAEMLQRRGGLQARIRQRQGHARIKREVRIDERVVGIAVQRDIAHVG